MIALRPLLILIALCLGATASPSLAQQASSYDKTRYDIADPGDPQHLPAGFEAMHGKHTTPRLDRTASRGTVTLVDGGAFTFGTGAAGSALEVQQPLAFGHPYALTSYPQVRVGGAWLDPLRFEGGTLSADADTLRYLSTTVSGLRAEVAIWMEEEGRLVQLAYTVTNTAAVAQEVALRFVYDAALGAYGDGVASGAYGTAQTDTAFVGADVPASLAVWERAGARRGLGLSLRALGADTLRLANWFDLHAQRDAADAVGPTGRPLFDLAIAPMWRAEALAPGAARTVTFTAERLPSDFGAGAFLRADLPARLGLDDGLYVPRTPRITVRAQSDSGEGTTTLRAVPDAPFVAGDSVAANIAYGSAAPAFATLSYESVESYDDTYPTLVVTAETPSGTVIDRLARRVYVPAVPVSEDGLAIEVDSVAVVATDDREDVEVFFSASIEDTRLPITSLRPSNVFLFDEQERIDAFTLEKDDASGLNAVDIVFVLDVTGSMSSEIAGVQRNIVEFADSLTSRGFDYRLGMVTFRDDVTETVPFSRDVQAFRSAVGRQTAMGGGDRAENSLDALAAAAAFDFRPAARRILVWITDADYYEAATDSRTQQTTQQVVNALLAVGVVVYSVGKPPFQTAFYNPIWMPTGGAYFDIDGNFRDILLAISRLPSSNRYRLAFSRAGRGGSRVLLQLRFAGLGGEVEIVVQQTGGSDADATAVEPGESVAGPPALAVFPTPSAGPVTLRAHDPRERGGSLAVFDALGRRVRGFALAPGRATHRVAWDGRGEAGQPLPAGLYFVRLRLHETADAAPRVLTQRLVRLR